MTRLALPHGGLTGTAQVVEHAAGEVADAAARPPLADAGRSSGDLAGALAVVTVLGQHLAEELAGLGTGLRRAEDLLVQTDRIVGDRFAGRMHQIGPCP